MAQGLTPLQSPLQKGGRGVCPSRGGAGRMSVAECPCEPSKRKTLKRTPSFPIGPGATAPSNRSGAACAAKVRIRE